MIVLTEDKKMLGYEQLATYPNISHFVTTRKGGSSTGAYSTFNCSPFVGDEASCVCFNQNRLMEDISKQAVELIIPHQTHGTNSLIIDSSFLNLTSVEKSSRLEGIDALITREPGCCICISTADCVPVLLYDTKHEIIAAVHAGWRGTVNFIIGHALERMSAYYGTCGQDVVACIGPSISFESFEVGEDVYEAFRQNEFDMSRLAKQQVSTGKWHIDLWEANRLQMLDFGIPASQIEIAGVCTYIHHDDFFSARRLGLSSGRILSGILKRS